MTTLNQNKLDASTIASYILVGVALLLVLAKGLLGALFAGLLVYALVQMMTPMLARKISDTRARMVAIAVISAVVIGVLSAAAWGTITFFRGDATNLTSLLKRMADIIDASRGQLPPWVLDHLPVNADALRERLSGWLREHSDEAKTLGKEAGRTLAHVLIGMIIGAMVSMGSVGGKYGARPFSSALMARMRHLLDAFRNIVFAQVWISGINTILSGIFILVILPLMGVQLPLAKTLIIITFFAGLLPVLGNLISNSVLVVVALSHSLHTAIGALAFMVVLHKLEYFLNARIIGSRIKAHAWELLVVMLVGETLFGVAGVIAAPVFYAYTKQELKARGLI
ncbi:MAG: AI-2E family transporter [Pseudomonadota bacterium]